MVASTSSPLSGTAAGMFMISYRMGRKALLLWLMVFMFLATSCLTNELPIIDQQERLAQSIDRGLMCPVCPSETIDESQVPIAKQMRGLVREKLAEGLTEEEVLGFFADRYGNGILAMPPKSGFNLLVWIVPPLIGIGGILLIIVIINQMKKPVSALFVQMPEFDGELDVYLEIVDRNIDVLKEDVMPDVEKS